MGRFGERVGPLEALTWAILLSGLLAVVALLVTRRGLGGLPDAWSSPKWLWLGAVFGTFVVFTITYASPRIGTTATIALLVAGQLAAGAVIDRFGLFGRLIAKKRRGRRKLAVRRRRNAVSSAAS